MPDSDESELSSASIPGVQRAAILLMTLGEQHAAEILRHMEPREVQHIGAAMASIRSVRHEEVEAVLLDFCRVARSETSMGVASHEYVRNVLVRALGREKAGGLMDRIVDGDNAQGVEALRWMDPRAIGAALRNEHPQVIAVVLSYLESDQSAQVLSLLSDAARQDVMRRIASLDNVPQSALFELNDMIEKEVVGRISAAASAKVGGTRKAAEIMNMLESSVGEPLMDAIRADDEELATEIEEQMFVFENLLDADDRGVQALLREVSSDVLLVALKGADEQVREKIFRNMSKRAAQTLRDDLEVMRPVRLSEVEASQKEVLTVVKRLAEAGDLVISRGGSSGGFV
jgi:flagellar motor switch protein FliG